MGEHPADCCCGEDDPRVVRCPVCGTDRPNGSTNACPQCAAMVRSVDGLSKALRQTQAEYAAFKAAWERGDERTMHRIARGGTR